MKKLLFLGGGFLQKYVISRARELGYYVICADANPNAVGFASSNEHAVIDIVDGDACLLLAKEKQIDGVLTAATDFGVLSMSLIAANLGLPGINVSSAKTIKNKAAVRKCLFDSKADDTSYSYEIASQQEIPVILDRIKFPVMVKPCDGSGSRGASKVERIQDFEKACLAAMDASLSHRAVAEPFIVGKEFGVESFVDQGAIRVLSVMQKEMTLPPYYAELGHAIPSGLSIELERKVRTCVEKALLALDVNHGSVNMDLLITETGEVHIIDVGARMGGNLIGSHIIPIGTGIDYMGNMIRAAVGDKTDWFPKAAPSPVATRLLALCPGKVIALPRFEDIQKKYDVAIEHHLCIGDMITPYRTNLDGCGYIIAQRGTVQEAIAVAEDVKQIIDDSIIRA